MTNLHQYFSSFHQRETTDFIQQQLCVFAKLNLHRYTRGLHSRCSVYGVTEQAVSVAGVHVASVIARACACARAYMRSTRTLLHITHYIILINNTNMLYNQIITFISFNVSCNNNNILFLTINNVSKYLSIFIISCNFNIYFTVIQSTKLCKLM